VRVAVATVFSLALIFIGLAPHGFEVEAKSRTHAKSSRRARVATNAKARDAKRHEAKFDREESEHFDAPSDADGDEQDNVERREEWFRFQRAYPFADVPPDARRLAWESRPRGGGLKNGDGRGILSVDSSVWTPLGPLPTTPKFPNNWGMTSGRINAIAVKPDDANVILVGASTGGVWRSIDGGATFAPASDSQVDLSVGSIAFAPSNPSIVYAGMGDIGNSYLGTGVLKSTDGGATWSRVSQVLGTDCASLPAFNTAGCLPAPAIAMNVLVDPGDPNRVYLTQYNYVNTTTNGGFASGFYISTDGGVTWTKTLGGLPRDLVMHPTNPQILYLAMRRVDTGQQLPGLYKSIDAGQTWTRIYDSPYDTAYAASPTLRDIRVAVTPAAPENVYVFAGKTISPANVRVNVSTDGGAHWDASTSANVDTAQFGYNTYIKVDPTNPSVIYVATRDVYKSVDGGANWSSITKNFFLSGGSWDHYAPTGTPQNPHGSWSHPDQHCFAFVPGNSNSFYIGNDGGLSKTTDGGATLTSLNATFTLSQFVGLVASPTNANLQVGGTQDNGTQARLAGGSGIGWTEFAEGDGGHPVINPVDSRAVLSTYVFGRIRRWQFSADGSSRVEKGGTASETTFGECDTSSPSCSPRIAFYAPFTSNGVDATVYFGTWKLYVSPNFADTVNTTVPTWNAPGGTTDLTKGGMVDCTATPKPSQCSDVLNAIGVAHTAYSSSQVIYTGSAQGRVMLSQDGGATWNDRTSNLPPRTIESITVAPSDVSGATAYVTLGGYGSGHVWKTTNAGQSWSDLSGTNAATKLPNIATTALLLDPTTPGVIYAGTDIGVFRSTTDGITWETFNNGIPPVPVTSFAVNAAGKIEIGTYGRGAYELSTVNDTATVQFAQATQTESEAKPSGEALLTVTRTGNLSSTVGVTVRTVDNPAAVACNDTTTLPGVAFARCDYATTVETLTFAPNETTKTFAVPLINDSYVEPAESVQLALSNPTGATLGAQSTMTLTITSDDQAGATNPYFNTDFFVRQQYLDLLSREPEAGQPWSALLSGCADQFNGNPSTDFNTNPSARCDRISLSYSFFGSAEFQLKGAFVFRFYKSSLGRLPTYAEIIPDMRSVTGVDAADLFAKKAAFTNAWTQRQEFKTRFDTLDNTGFVNALMTPYTLQQLTTPDPANPDGTAKVTLTRAALVNSLNASTLTRAQVVRAVADSDEVSTREFNSMFVAMQYFGYLRRDPDAGYNDWLSYLTAHPGDFRTMVFGFIFSPEYKSRFGAP
jgi:photosystem II stability/assembly factor-like uncharacterized protein